MSSKTTKNAKSASVAAATTILDAGHIVRRINGLTCGHSTTIPDYGVIKCTLAASDAKDKKRRFMVSKSNRINSRKKFTFSELVEAFGLRR